MLSVTWSNSRQPGEADGQSMGKLYKAGVLSNNDSNIIIVYLISYFYSSVFY